MTSIAVIMVLVVLTNMTFGLQSQDIFHSKTLQSMLYGPLHLNMYIFLSQMLLTRMISLQMTQMKNLTKL
jgi:hypothetical protein